MKSTWTGIQGTALVEHWALDITLWDDPMEDGSVTIIYICELFKETAFIGADKICAGSDNCKE